jgi:hypothetical protein
MITPFLTLWKAYPDEREGRRARKSSTRRCAHPLSAARGTALQVLAQSHLFADSTELVAFAADERGNRFAGAGRGKRGDNGVDGAWWSLSRNFTTMIAPGTLVPVSLLTRGGLLIVNVPVQSW